LPLCETLDVVEGPKPIVFELEHPSRVIEGLLHADGNDRSYSGATSSASDMAMQNALTKEPPLTF